MDNISSPAIPLHYDFKTVVSAQQMRSLRSKTLIFRLVAVVVVWAIIMYFVPGFTSGEWDPGVGKNALITLGVIIAISAIAIFFGPMVDYITNQVWRKPVEIVLNPDHLLLRLVGQEKGAILEWAEISKTLENERAIILFAAREQDFIIIPLADLRASGREGLLRSLIEQHRPVKH